MARHLRAIRFSPNPQRPPDLAAWPFTVPAVAQLVREGRWEVPDGVTVLVGENGSGKSTLVEAIAAAYPRRGFVGRGAQVAGPGGAAEDGPLPWHLSLDLDPMASPAGFFLRAELMHGYLSRVPGAHGEVLDLNAASHGESFLALVRERFADVGVYLLDEPEAALSFTSSLALAAVLADMAREGSQVLVATHSPVLAAIPGATIWEVGEEGCREVGYDELDLVRSWRAFLEAPERFTRHL